MINTVFNEYVKRFDMKDERVLYKYHHSYRVLELVEQIVKELDLTDRDIYLLRILGLFHDIGRFMQVTKYKTYNDSKSIDHGDYGCQVFLEEDFFPDLTREEKELIAKSIRYHNKYEVPNMDKRSNLFSQVIREADRLDIIREQGNENEDNEIIIKDIFIETLKNKEFAKKEWLDTDTDYILFLLCWIPNFTFKYSKEFIDKNEIVKNKIHLLENKDNIDKINEIKNIISKNMEE